MNEEAIIWLGALAFGVVFYGAMYVCGRPVDTKISRWLGIRRKGAL